jgi:Mrp family chromosome partitioning ATPase/Uma2 family endonuclease
VPSAHAPNESIERVSFAPASQVTDDLSAISDFVSRVLGADAPQPEAGLARPLQQSSAAAALQESVRALQPPPMREARAVGGDPDFGDSLQVFYARLIEQDVAAELATRILREVEGEMQAAVDAGAVPSELAVRESIERRIAAMLPEDDDGFAAIGRARSRADGQTARKIAFIGPTGVGKTTTSANLAVALARLGKTVVCVDADIGLRNLDVVLGLENRIVYDLVNVIEGECRLKQALIRDKRIKGLHLLPAAQTRDKNAVTPDDMRRLIAELKEEMDYVLIDCPAGIEQGFKNSIAGADRALLSALPALWSILEQLVRSGGVGAVFVAPSEWVLDGMTLVQPDLYVVPLVDGRRPRTDEERGHPLLFIEILSPSTARFDRVVKRGRYQRAGIEYWIVDLDSRLIERWLPGDERPSIHAERVEWQPVGVETPFVIALEPFFTEVLGPA